MRPKMANEPEVAFDLDLKIRLDEIPKDKKIVRFDADEDVYAALAEVMGVSALSNLSVKFELRRLSKGVSAKGDLTAKCTQPCVVTLDPVDQIISAKMERFYLPKSMQAAEPKPGSETFVDLQGEDLPEYFSGEAIDLTNLILDTLGTEIDLYPRRADASISSGDVIEDDEKQNPFAILAEKFPRN